MIQENNPWKTHRTRLVYDNSWIRVTESDVTNPGGGSGIYGVVHFKNRAIGVVPIDEDNQTWLVGQYRYALDTYEWEIPEGGSPEGEDPLISAKRELREEAGLIAEQWEVLLDDIALSNSVTTERATVFVARELRATPPSPEETEQLKIWKLPLSEAIAMAKEGRITDAVSVMALLKLAAS